MKKRQAESLILPCSRGWTRAGLAVLLSAIVSVGAKAQTNDDGVVRPPQDSNSELRVCTWSVYAQGGMSWATDVWYQNLDAKRSYQQSPAVGGGIDFTIRPWVRVGAEYLWSNYRREQRFSAIDAKTMPVKAYGNYLMNYHNVKLGVGFNLMELWPRRGAQWLNIWAGTGVGYTIAKGNEYGIYFSNTQSQGGQTTPVGDGTTIGNESNVTITGNVRSTNRHEDFNTFFVPASVHVEADLCRQFTIGLKGEMDWLFNRKDVAPRNYAFALVTLRYNFVPGRAKVQKAYYQGEISALNSRLEAMRLQADADKASAERESSERRLTEQRVSELRDSLTDCENSKPVEVVARPSHFVQFANNSSSISDEELDRLRAFAKTVSGKRLSLVAEASTSGTEEYNQRLSERRLASVVNALVKEGFSLFDLNPRTAIGAREGKPSAEGRRVSINVEN